jgi:hydrogenase/urease accessory protein HupE
VIACVADVVLVLGLLAFARYPAPAVPQIAEIYGAGLMTGYAHKVQK